MASALEGVSGVLVAPGFGDRGIDGKIEAVRWARENGVPFFGICLGMQVATIEFARHVAGLEGAHSTEFDADNPFPVISMMAEQKTVTDKGGTMRLGAYTCALTEGTLAREVYGAETVQERHRHRFEVNNDLRYKLREAGLVFSGVNPDRDLVEIIELPRPVEGDGAVAGPTHTLVRRRPVPPRVPIERDRAAPAVRPVRRRGRRARAIRGDPHGADRPEPSSTRPTRDRSCVEGLTEGWTIVDRVIED